LKNLSKLDKFYSSLDSISVVNSNLDEKRKNLQNIIKLFNKNIQDKTFDKELLEKNDVLGKLLEKTINSIKLSSQNWVNNFEKLLQREKFRSDLENYFIVIIYGKVKAGKSSLGNFIAKHNTTEKKAIFFKYDEAGKEIPIKKLEEIDESDEFAVRNTECTIEIQGFKLSGLAWIDTPGLGSMVEANGKLAKDYIQSADYIIYPTSSNSPLQQDEIAQIKELFEQNKTVTICITKSDTMERQKDENGKYKRDEHGKIAKFLVNKSFENRIKQENYVNSEINKINGSNKYKIGDVISISVHAANKGIDIHDKELFDNSNIPKFYELLTEVVEKKAKALKSNTPYNGLLSFVDNELMSNDKKESSIIYLENLIKQVDNEIKKAIESFEDVKKITDSEIETKIDNIVSKYYQDINKNNSKEKFNLIDKEIKIEILKIIQENIKEILKNFDANLLSVKLNNNNEFNIQDKYEEIEITYEDRDLINYITLGYLGRRYKTITDTVKIGDNKEEIMIKFKKDRTNIFIENAKESYDYVMDTLFKPLMEIFYDIEKDLEGLKFELEKYKQNLKR